MATWYIVGWVISGLISACLMFLGDPSFRTIGDALTALFIGLLFGPILVLMFLVAAVWIYIVKPVFDIEIKKGS